MIYCKVQKKEVPLIIPFGGGVNPTAMVLGAIQRGIEIDLILFADTGGEKPETYMWLHEFHVWLKENHNLEIKITQAVNREGEPITLEQYSLKANQLPSLAYGFKSCSQKHKVAPCDKYIRKHVKVPEGYKAVRFVGYDLDESHRYEKAKIEYNTHICQFPLIEWGLDRQGCEDLIKSHGFEPPIKSACFFCPASKKHEIEWLADNHPALFKRACKMEENAELTSVKGFGRNYSWSEYIKFKKQQPSLLDHFTDTVLEPCECVD